MKTKIFFIGSILLITNLVYALPIQNTPRQRTSVSKLDYAFIAIVIEELVSRGLERDVAEQKVINLFGNNIANVTLSLHHFMLEFKSITEKDISRYLSQKALFDQQIDLTSYDALLGMLQTIDSKLARVENYSKLQHIAKINKSFITT